METNREELPSIEKLRWQCRRGMLELDLILKQFLENKYNQLNYKEKELFCELLSQNDQDLQQWLMNKTSPADSRFLEIIDLINRQ